MGPFLMLKALLKELRSYRTQKRPLQTALQTQSWPSLVPRLSDLGPVTPGPSLRQDCPPTTAPLCWHSCHPNQHQVLDPHPSQPPPPAPTLGHCSSTLLHPRELTPSWQSHSSQPSRQHFGDSTLQHAQPPQSWVPGHHEPLCLFLEMWGARVGMQHAHSTYTAADG